MLLLQATPVVIQMLIEKIYFQKYIIDSPAEREKSYRKIAFEVTNV